MAKRRHHRRSRMLSNPFSASALLAKPKELLSADFAVDAGAAAAGFVLPNMMLQYVPPTLRNTKIKVYASKFAIIAGLSVAGNIVSKRVSRMLLLGGGVSLIMDVWTEFMASRIAGAPAGTSMYYGDDNALGDTGDIGDDMVSENDEMIFG